MCDLHPDCGHSPFIPNPVFSDTELTHNDRMHQEIAALREENKHHRADEVDIGFEIAPGGQKRHVWIMAADVSSHIQELKAEITALRLTNAQLRKLQCTGENSDAP